MQILAVAGDAGGARALLPVIKKMKNDGTASFDCRAYAAAFEIWQNAGLEPVRKFPAKLDNFDKIILGTTVGEEMWEPEIVRQARQNQIYTVSVLDFWSNYRERFITGNGEFELPDAIAVMDEWAKEEMLELGFPAAHLKITGQPAFDEIIKHKKNIVRENERLTSENDEDTLRVLYVSQPLSILECNQVLGFDEHQALAGLVSGFDEICRQRRKKILFSIKPHPCETNPEYRISSDLAAAMRIEILPRELHPYQAVLASDMVVGTNSVLLMEACFLGKPTLSYQPNLQVKDALKSNTFGWSRAVYRREELFSALDEELFDSGVIDKRRKILADISQPNGSAERVIRLLLKEN